MRSKLVLSYLLVVFIPYAAIGFYAIKRTSGFIVDQALENEKKDISQLRENIRNQLLNYVRISNDIYFDSKIWIFLRRHYKNDSDYIDEYLDYVRPVMQKPSLIDSSITGIRIYIKNRDIPANNSEFSYVEDGTAESAMYDLAVKNGGLILWKQQVDVSGKHSLVLYRSLNLNNVDAGMLVISFAEDQLYSTLHMNSKENRDVCYWAAKYHYDVKPTEMCWGKTPISCRFIRKPNPPEHSRVSL